MHHHHQAQKSQERLKEEAETVRHCETLGLQMTSSSITEVNKGKLKAAFRRLALTLHPDKRENCPLAKEQFIRVKEAYDYLLPKCSGGEGPESGRTRERGRGGGPRDSQAQWQQQKQEEKYSCFENSPKPKPPTSMPMPMPPPPPKPEKPKKEEGEKKFSESSEQPAAASRFKLYLGFSEFCKGITVMVLLKRKKQQQQQENLLNFENNYYEAETKFFEVRVPAGASPGDTFFGYPIIFEKDNKSSSSSNVSADPAVQFELADLPGQQHFHRDPTLPGHLHTTVEVSAADWADLEADRRKYLLLKVPTIERGGGGGGEGDDTKHITHLLMKSPASLKLEKEFRLPGRGLPITTTGSSLRGDLIVTIAVVPEVGQLKRKQQQQQLWYLEESPQQQQRQQLQRRHQELFEVFQSYQPKQQEKKEKKEKEKEKEKEEESKDSPSKLSDKLSSDQLTKTKFSAEDLEKRTFFSDGGDSASSSSSEQQTMSRLLGSFSTLFK